MAHVTLIGKKIAEKNLIFRYLGPQSDCKNCKLKNVCFNLKQGRRYKITNVRNKKHNCNIHEGNVAVVEVEEQPILTAIDKKITEGTTTKIKEKECNNIGCQNYPLCFNIAISKDKKYKVKKTHDSIDCPKGYKLKKAELEE
ncbi:MAG: UPF0179 family protein [Candidatus Thermoplasmatota archaeon]